MCIRDRRDTAAFPGDWPLVIACGVTGGIFGAMFSRLTLTVTRRLRRWRDMTKTRRVAAAAAIAGVIVAVIGIATGGMTFGTSYAYARAGIEGASLPWYFFFGKFVATLASVSYTHLDVYKRQHSTRSADRRGDSVAGYRTCLLYTSRCV